MQEELTKYIEGKTELFVPTQSLILKVPPKEPAFFNPRGIESRDISVIAYETFSQLSQKPIIFTDVLCGIGARGIRVAKETSVSKVYLNDMNPSAIDIVKKNIENNSVIEKCIVSNDDANHFFTTNRKEGNLFNIIDIDPFGTPSPYLEDAVKTIRDGGLISMTATDTAVLCGLHPHVALRKYYGLSVHTEYCHEVGLRLLFGALALSAARYDKGITPLFCHSTRHYLRTYAQVTYSAKQGDSSLEKMGYINHCTKCNERSISKIPLEKCPECGAKITYGGPLWTGKIFDKKFVNGMKKTVENMNTKKYSKMMTTAFEETEGPPMYFLISMICDRLQISTPAIEKIIERLRKKGFYASRTSINNKAVKTNASSKTVNEILKELSKI
jgi:tRNA (guanine26-N2/guanine27-N2)-dimethyltransferase